jgi:endoglucanase
MVQHGIICFQRSLFHPEPLKTMITEPSRRDFLKAGLAATALSGMSLPALAQSPNTLSPVRNVIPRWRGFNLMAFFSAFSTGSDYGDMTLKDDDLKWIRDWGFDYVRLPFDYWFFVQGNWRETRQMNLADIRNVDEAALEKLDRAVEQCVQMGLHVTVNMHRAPGYCINGWDREPANLFKDEGAEDAFAFFWELLARRYKGYSRDAVSFNLVNEAPNVDERMSRADYRRVMLRAQRIIHAISPDRVVIIDGTGVGREVVLNLLDEPVAQAFHAYDPFRITHYKATWVGNNSDWPVPQWPYPNADGSHSGVKELAVQFAPWAELVRLGIGVHCSEFGCYKFTPHKVFLPWIEEVLALLKQHDIGWGLWNFRGDFGVLDSGRTDVKYEDWRGHKLDRELLNLLQRY